MRGSESPNPSSRVAWCVAGIGGLLLLAWAFGGFDVGGPETGHLADGPLASQFDDIQPEPFESLPEQYEPSEPVVVTAAPPNEPDAWADSGEAVPDIPEPDGPGIAAVDGAFAEMPGTVPPEFGSDPAGEFGTNLGPEGEIRTASLEHPLSEFMDGQTVEVEPRYTLDLDRIDSLIRSGQVGEAHAALSQIWSDHPRARATIQNRIEETSQRIFFEPEQHFMEPYQVQAGDTLRRIGQKYDLPWEYVVRLNRVDPRRIRPGHLLKVVRGPFSAHVDLSEFTLTILNRRNYVRHYPIGVGKDAGSPVGRFSVLEKVANPRYTDPSGHVIAADDPNNPIGERWIGLGRGYGIHGTVDSTSIGREDDAGCIRMRPDDVAEVFDLLGVGSEVNIVP